jgi:hypothetical protein
MSQKQTIYTPEHWLRDAAWIKAKLEAESGRPDKWGLILAYFDRNYGPTADWHHDRLIAALKYFALHFQEFDESLLSISYTTDGAPSDALLLALHKIFSVGQEAPVAEVKALARKIENIRD